MRLTPSGYRVAVVGSSTLLGKELLAVLDDRQFPVSRLMKIDDEEEEPAVPILDLGEYPPQEQAQAAAALAALALQPEEVKASELDFAFVARVPRQIPSFISEANSNGCIVIDLSGTLWENLKDKTGNKPGATRTPEAVLSIPSLDRDYSTPAAAVPRLISPHPAAIVLASILLRTVARFPLTNVVGLVLNPASEIGPEAIAELQSQTVNLLSFQKIPQAVFGSQLAFNVLPRLSKSRRGSGPYRDELTDLENLIRSQLRRYTGERTPRPALRVIQTPVFHSLVASVYLESESPAASEAVERALAGSQFKVRRSSEQAPSQVESAGAADILVDAISTDSDHPQGVWIWATADNMRLAATNAVEIAEVQALMKQATRRLV